MFLIENKQFFHDATVKKIWENDCFNTVGEIVNSVDTTNFPRSENAKVITTLSWVKTCFDGDFFINFRPLCLKNSFSATMRSVNSVLESIR